MEDQVVFGIWENSSEEILRKQYPVHRACRDGDLETLAGLIVEAQSELSREDSFYGWTPLHWAAYFGKLGCVMKLLEWGQDVDMMTDRLRQTPSHIAAFAGHSYCLKWFIHCGSNLNKQDYLGETPTHKAARTGSIECVSLLAAHGARLHVQNNNHQTAAQVASSCGHVECARYIETAMLRQPQLPGMQTASGDTHHRVHDGIVLPQVNRGQGDQPMNAEAMLDVETQGSNQVTNTSHMRSGIDVLMHKGVSRNVICVAGRKRSREDDDESVFKRRKEAGENPFESEGMEMESTMHSVEDFQMVAEGDDMVSGEVEAYQSVLRVPVEPRGLQGAPLELTGCSHHGWPKRQYYSTFH